MEITALEESSIDGTEKMDDEGQLILLEPEMLSMVGGGDEGSGLLHILK